MDNIIIGESQHAFVGGRQILDATPIVNEIVDNRLNKKRKGVLCKLDMEKVYDHVNWAFVDYMLMRLGFGDNGEDRLKHALQRLPMLF